MYNFAQYSAFSVKKLHDQWKFNKMSFIFRFICENICDKHRDPKEGDKEKNKSM